MNTLKGLKWFLLVLLCIHLDGCESHTFGDAEFFQMSGTKVSFDEAEKKCEERGATLPEIYDEDEWEQVGITSNFCPASLFDGGRFTVYRLAEKLQH